MAVDAVEATESLPKEAGLVGLDGPLDELDLTKMLVENFEDNGPEETSPSGDAVEEAEPVEESTEEAGDTARSFTGGIGNGPCWFLDASPLSEGLIPISNE